MNSDDYAIVVAIDAYPAFDPLSSPAVDALKFWEWLVSPKGGNLPGGNVTFIRSPQYTSGPTIDSVKPTLDEVDQAFKKHVQT